LTWSERGNKRFMMMPKQKLRAFLKQRTTKRLLLRLRAKKKKPPKQKHIRKNWKSKREKPERRKQNWKDKDKKQKIEEERLRKTSKPGLLDKGLPMLPLR